MFTLLKICIFTILIVTIFATPIPSAPDANHVSLQDFIGNIEKSLIHSAISVGSIIDDNQASLDEVRPDVNTGHDVSKRSTFEEPIALPSTVEETKVVALPEPQIVLQTTEKVPNRPHHILIDRISVQPHNVAVSFLPTFEVHHTKLTSKLDENNKPISEGAQISISKTVITTVNKDEDGSKAVVGVTPFIVEAKPLVIESKPIVEDSKPVQIVKAESAVATPVDKLNQAELELKTKVAEIEADPVILSTRN